MAWRGDYWHDGMMAWRGDYWHDGMMAWRGDYWPGSLSHSDELWLGGICKDASSQGGMSHGGGTVGRVAWVHMQKAPTQDGPFDPSPSPPPTHAPPPPAPSTPALPSPPTHGPLSLIPPPFPHPMFAPYLPHTGQHRVVGGC